MDVHLTRFFVIAATFMLVVSFLFLRRVVRLGRKLRRERVAGYKYIPNGVHKWAVRRWIQSTVLVVIFADAGFWLGGRPLAKGPLFPVHFTADILLLVLTILALRLNGARRPDVHRWIVYPLAADYMVVLVTGARLLYLLWQSTYLKTS